MVRLKLKTFNIYFGGVTKSSYSSPGVFNASLNEKRTHVHNIKLIKESVLLKNSNNILFGKFYFSNVGHKKTAAQPSLNYLFMQQLKHWYKLEKQELHNVLTKWTCYKPSLHWIHLMLILLFLCFLLAYWKTMYICVCIHTYECVCTCAHLGK